MNINYDICSREELIASHQEQAWKIEQLTHKLKELERAVFGRKSERSVADVPREQLLLAFSQGEENTPAPTQQEKEQITYTRSKPKAKQHPVRQELPAHLPRKIIDLYPDGSEGGTEIGAPEVTEVQE